MKTQKRKIGQRINGLELLFKARLVVAITLSALLVMALGIVDIKASNSSNMNMTTEVTTGSLDLTAPSDEAFNNGAPGSTIIANTQSGTGNEIIPNDTRGSLAGWSIIGYFTTNWLKTTDANTQMPLNDGGTLRMYWGANNGSGGTTINNITGASGDALGGANNNFPGITSANNLTLMLSNTSATNGAGAFNMCNLKFNYNIPASASATNYTTRLKLTIA